MTEQELRNEFALEMEEISFDVSGYDVNVFGKGHKRFQQKRNKYKVVSGILIVLIAMLIPTSVYATEKIARAIIRTESGWYTDVQGMEIEGSEAVITLNDSEEESDLVVDYNASEECLYSTWEDVPGEYGVKEWTPTDEECIEMTNIYLTVSGKIVLREYVEYEYANKRATMTLHMLYGENDYVQTNYVNEIVAREEFVNDVGEVFYIDAVKNETIGQNEYYAVCTGEKAVYEFFFSGFSMDEVKDSLQGVEYGGVYEENN